MKTLKDCMDWIDQRTGLKSCGPWIEERTGVAAALRNHLDRPLPGGAICRNVWPSMIGFTCLVQLITGLFLWMYYSPSAQTAWESVYFLQYEVTAGWLLRGVHHYAAQVLVALVALYLISMLLRGIYRRPRECVFWVVTAMGLVAMSLCLTGDLLAWDQNSYASTLVRTKFLLLLPWIGDDLFKLVAGGPAFGHHTLTRMFTFHVGLFAVAMFALLLLHGWLVRRAEAAAAKIGGEGAEDNCPLCTLLGPLVCRVLPQREPAEAETPQQVARYWPDQLVRNALAWLAVTLVILLLVFWHGFSGNHAGQPPGDYLGVALGAPADPDPANFYGAARPEWSLRGVYEFSNLFPGSVKILPIFIFPGLLLVLVLSMPCIARLKHGHPINLGVTAVLLIAIVFLSFLSVWHDADSTSHQAALAAGRQDAQRVKELARAAEGIPVGGALALLRNDPKTQGPKLWQKHCAICHDYGATEDRAIKAETPSAPDLYGFASRRWIAGFLDSEQIKSPKYYGNTRFAGGAMVRYVEECFAKLGETKQQAIVAALAAEAELELPQEQDGKDRNRIGEGRQLIVSEGCTRCHRFRDEGDLGAGPDLTGYGSREWIIGIVADPTHPSFYGTWNDRMPAYIEQPAQPAENRLTAAQVDVLARWLRGEWYEPPARDEAAGEPDTRAAKGPPAILAVGEWVGRRPKPEPDAKARDLFRWECAVCHDCTAPPGRHITAAYPSAPDLGGFASEQWIAGLLDPEQIAGSTYFGNTRFAAGAMVRYVKKHFGERKEEERRAIAAALSAEAQRNTQGQSLSDGQSLVDQGRQLILSEGCTRCHRFGDQGPLGYAPDLTGYGSREWIMGIVIDPAHPSLYGSRNDRMPAYLRDSEEPSKSLLAAAEVAVVADWLRGETYGPWQDKAPAMLAANKWLARQPEVSPPSGPHAEARQLFQAECAMCHACSGAPGGDVPSAFPSAPDLGGFAGEAWIAGLLDPKQVAGPKYFGNSAFADGSMVGFVKGNLKELKDEMEDEFEDLIAALAEEATRASGPDAEEPDEDTKFLFDDFTCAGCHPFYDVGEDLGTAPDLTRYGSREWLLGIVRDPAHKRFYGNDNDGMPSYLMWPESPERNLLTDRQIEVLADWLRTANRADK